MILWNKIAAVSIVMEAARKVSPQEPFILLPQEHRSFIANSVLNSISPLSAPGFFVCER